MGHAQPGRGRINQEGEIKKDDTRLGQESFFQREWTVFVVAEKSLDATASSIMKIQEAQDQRKCQGPGQPWTVFLQPAESIFLDQDYFTHDQSEGDESGVLLGTECQHRGDKAGDPEHLFPRPSVFLSCADVEVHGENVEHPCKGTHPLNNIGDGFCLDWVNRPDGAAEQCDGIGSPAVFFRHGG